MLEVSAIVSDEVEGHVRNLVFTGRYTSQTQVIRKALHLLLEREGVPFSPPLAPVKSNVVKKVLELEPELRKSGITSMALFGSVVDGTATPESDIDLLVEIDTNICTGLFEYGDIRDSLAKNLGHIVDMVERQCLDGSLRERAFAEAELIF